MLESRIAEAEAATDLGEEGRGRLEKEQADLGAVTARKADFEARLAFNVIRPTAIDQRLAEATEQREAVAVRIQPPPDERTSPALLQAQRWTLETEYQALSTKIKLLDQDLLTRPARIKLLEAKRDREAASIAWIGARVETINALVNRKRKEAAEQARIEAERARRATADLDPRLRLPSERNAAVSQEINAIADQLRALDARLAQVEELGERIDADYADARATALAAELKDAPTPLLRERLRDLLMQRQTLDGDALEAHELYLTKQRELDAAEGALLSAAAEYQGFLTENLLWLRSGEPVGLDALIGLPSEVRAMLDPAKLRELTHTAIGALIRSPAFRLAVAVGVGPRWRRLALRRRIADIATRVGKPTTDSFGLTLRTLDLNPAARGGTPAQPIALPLYAAITRYLFVVFHPRTGVFSRLRDRHAYGLFGRTRCGCGSRTRTERPEGWAHASVLDAGHLAERAHQADGCSSSAAKVGNGE